MRIADGFAPGGGSFATYGGLVPRSRVPRRLMFDLLTANSWPFHEVSAATTLPCSTLAAGQDFTILATSTCMRRFTVSSGTRRGRRLRSLVKMRVSTPMAAVTPGYDALTPCT